jgi:hypothetical protein
MMLLNMSVIHRRSTYDARGWKKNIICPILFEESTVAGKKLVAMIEDAALCHVLASSVFQLNDAPPHFCTVLMPFCTGSFLMVGEEERAQFSDLLVF